MSRAFVEVLGPFRIRDADGSLVPVPQAHQRIVLAALALAGNHGHTADELLDAIWGDDQPRSARKTLQGYIARLRRLLGRESIVTQPGGHYCLNRLKFDLDVDRVKSYLDRGRTQRSVSERLHLFGKALSLFRGEPLSDISSPLLAETYSSDLRDIWALTVECWANEQMRIDARLAVEPLRAVCAREPYRESLWALLIDALSLSARRASALDTYQICRRALLEDLGIEPGIELRAAQRRALDPAVPQLAEIENEWTRLVEQIAESLRRQRDHGGAVAISGPPGSGKSRIAHAVAHLLSAWPCLTVIDDITTLAQCERLFPVPPGRCLVLCTTMPKLALPGLETVALRGYSVDQMLSLLPTATSDGRVLLTPQAVATLENVLAGLPAAIHALSARMAAEPELRIDEVVARLQDPWRRLDLLASGPHNVRRHLQRAYDRMSQPAQRAFRLLGWLESDSFTENAASAAVELSVNRVRELLAEVRCCGLLQSDASTELTRHMISPISRSFARETSNDVDDPMLREGAVRRALTAWYSAAEIPVWSAGLASRQRDATMGPPLLYLPQRSRGTLLYG